MNKTVKIVIKQIKQTNPLPVRKKLYLITDYYNNSAKKMKPVYIEHLTDCIVFFRFRQVFSSQMHIT